MKACLVGDSPQVEAILVSGEDPNAADSAGKTALFFAAVSGAGGAHSLVAQLVRHGANMNAKDANGNTFIDYAAANGSKEVVQAAVETLDASTKEGKNTIGVLIRTDDPEVRFLLKEKLGSKHFKYFDNKFRKKSKRGNSSATSGASSCKSISLARMGEKDFACRTSEQTIKKGDRRKGDVTGGSVDPFGGLGERAESNSFAMSESQTKVRRGQNWLGLEDEPEETPRVADFDLKVTKKGWLDDDLAEEDVKFTFKTVDLIRKNDASNRAGARDDESPTPQGETHTPRPSFFLGERQGDTPRIGREVAPEIIHRNSLQSRLNQLLSVG